MKKSKNLLYNFFYFFLSETAVFFFDGEIFLQSLVINLIYLIPSLIANYFLYKKYKLYTSYKIILKYILSNIILFNLFIFLLTKRLPLLFIVIGILKFKFNEAFFLQLSSHILIIISLIISFNIERYYKKRIFSQKK